MQSEYLTALGEQLTDAMSACFENKSLVKFEHVDIGAELQTICLLNIRPSEVSGHCLFLCTLFNFASEACPPSLGVGKLAATLKKRRKQGQQNVFVCVDLRECAACLACLLGERGIRLLFEGGCRRCAAKPKPLSQTVRLVATQASCGWTCANGNWRGADI